LYIWGLDDAKLSQYLRLKGKRGWISFTDVSCILRKAEVLEGLKNCIDCSFK
jgi:hypothetical protein